MPNKPLAIVVGAEGNLGPIWADKLKEMGYKVFNMGLPVCDTTDTERLDIVIDGCIKDFGRPSVIVCNSAIDNPPKGEGSLWDNYDKILDVNLKGHFNVLSRILPNHVDRGCVVVMISSIMAHSGADYRRYKDVGLQNFTKPSAYNASKAGLMALAKCITTQYGQFGVRGVSLSFGPVDTGKFDPVFKERILRDIPTGELVTVDDLKASLEFVIKCKSFAGTDCLIDSGLLAW